MSASASKVYSGVLSGFYDFFYFSYRSDRQFEKRIRILGAEHLEQALSHGRGVIGITAHFGPWELLPRALKLVGYNIAVIGRSMSLQGTSKILNKLRQKPGVQTIDRGAGAAPIVRILRENRILGMLTDQSTRGVQSESVAFLGRPAPTPVAPAVFARKLEVPVVTMHIKRDKCNKFLLQIDAPLYFTEDDSISDILEELNTRIGKWIQETPEQWVWFHRRWRK